MCKNKYFIFTVLLFLTIFNLKPSHVIADYYSWKDENGVTQITDDPEKIPPQYKKTAKRYEEVRDQRSLTSSLEEINTFVNKHSEKLIYLLFLILLGLILIYLLKKLSTYFIKRKETLANSLLNNKIDESGINSMNSEDFKKKVEKVLINENYQIDQPKSLISSNVDFIGVKNNKKYLISINESINDVSRIHIHNVESEKNKLGFDKSMIITRRNFQKEALELAQKLDCELVNKEKLATLILKLEK